MKKSFVGLNRYQIGWPPIGWAYLYLDFGLLKNMSHQEALEKLEAMGYEPSLRLKQTTEGLIPCALLKVVKLDDPTSPESPFEDIIETLQVTFDGAVRSPCGRPKGYLQNIGLDPENLPAIAEEELESVG
ncbi:MAG: hypothetical protein AAGA60_31100 [Cyanobacteria bacterium P01_E01_bin.42]